MSSPEAPTSSAGRPSPAAVDEVALFAGGLVVWHEDRLGDLAALAAVALPDERISVDELEASCYHDGGVVIGSPDGFGAVAAVRRAHPGRTLDEAGPGFLRFLAVDPRAQGAGLGRALLSAAHAWLFAHGAERVHAGGEAPFYLWPGVDVRAMAAWCLLESEGYEAHGTRLNLAMSVPLPARSDVRDRDAGHEVRRVLADADAAAVLAFAASNRPEWVAEAQRAVEHGSCLAAFTARGDVVGFICHSVNRAGWVGPLLVDPGWRGRGIGRALLVAASRDLSAADLRSAEIAWVGPVRFYAKSADAWVARVFRTLSLPRPPG